jgi:hypothetical protein
MRMVGRQRPKPARHPKEPIDGQLGVRESDGVRWIGGWLYKNACLLDEEEVISNTLGRRWGAFSPGVLVYLTSKRIVSLPDRMFLTGPEDAYLATLRRLTIHEKRPLWFWRLFGGGSFRPLRWFRFETASDRVAFISSERPFYDAVLEMAKQRNWRFEDDTA